MTTAPDIEQALARFADNVAQPRRSPVLHQPSEAGLEYENVSFPATDGVPLEGWFIPAPGATRLIIANHPLGFSRSGFPTHLEPWRSVWAPTGNDFELNFVPDYKILHDAGYAVLAYDLRNHGLSAAANGGVVTSGFFEARDVVGALNWARERPETGDMAIGLFSRCFGAASTFAAMAQFPRAFDGVGALVAAQPITPRVVTPRWLAYAGLGEHYDRLEELVVQRVGAGLGLADRTPTAWAGSVRVPTFLYGVRDDLLTVPADLEGMYDAIPIAEKKLQWIENTPLRWDGYAEFQRRPEPMLAWFDTHL
ncbi:alpha/beta hydrolase family protein [Lentzea sp. NPDC059081]|uniref:alpha/beta hydrolase family protein n=1 Tax=Lentzea sp. NPDC059081 TaxID=3346719 RepID=UPI003684BAB9